MGLVILHFVSLQVTGLNKETEFDMFKKQIGFTFILFILLSFLALNTSQKPSLQAAPNNQTLPLGGERIFYSAPVAADLNGNGRKEIVVGGYDGMLYVAAYNGSSWGKVWDRQTALDLNDASPPPPVLQPTGRIDSAPAIGDIDKDGQLEIVVTTGGLPNSATPEINRNGGIIVYELISSVGSNWEFELKSGWPFIMPDTMGQGNGGRDPDGVADGIKAAPTLGDIDGDGDLEIITIAYDRRIRAFHHDGTSVAGWPIQRDSGDIILRGGESSAAIADIDNDGIDEVIIGTNSPPWNGDDQSGPFPPQYNTPDYSLATLWAINGDSSLVPGFPVITQQIVKSSPAVGDIDGDGDLEIVVGTGEFPGYVNGRQVYAWHHDGTPVSGWPTSTDDFMLSSPALADLDKNGTLDVIIGCGIGAPPFCSKLYAWDGNGNNLSGFPIDTGYNLPYPPVVADIDGDDNLEVILTSFETNKVVVVQHNGKNGATDESRITGAPFNLSTPLVDDLDNDGSLETVVGSESSGQAALFIFEEANSTDNAPEHLPWPMFQRNMQHTGLVLPPRLNDVSKIYIFHQQGSGSTANHMITVENDGGGELTWNLDNSGTGGVVSVDTAPTLLKAGENTAVSLSVDTTPYLTDQWHNLGTLQLSATSPDSTVQNTPQTINVNLFIGDIAYTYLPIILK